MQHGHEGVGADVGRRGDEDPLEVGEDVGGGDVPEAVLVVLVALGEAGHGEAGRLGALLVLVHEAGAQDGQRLL